jgi:hypothetical protein
MIAGSNDYDCRLLQLVVGSPDELVFVAVSSVPDSGLVSSTVF